MSDHCEEQEMEAEALAAIFDLHLRWFATRNHLNGAVKLLPVDGGSDDENHVAIRLLSQNSTRLS